MQYRVRGVNEAVAEVLFGLSMNGVREESRNGPVWVSPEPMLVEYKRPMERVLFSPVRDANPFFHFMEALWMLGGRNDVAFVEKFNKGMAQYSDDGLVLKGAYGHRWRKHFGMDQLEEIARLLKFEPNTRRAVLGMWDPTEDIPSVNFGQRDVPCNTHAYFDLRGGALNMTVCNRSNDVIWGMLGANAVHFSFLLEYMAAKVGVTMGVYRQFSNNVHAYMDKYPPNLLKDIAIDADVHRYRDTGTLPTFEGDMAAWEADLQGFLTEGGPLPTRTYFFRAVARPMLLAWRAHKAVDVAMRATHLSSIAAPDWRRACTEWCARRDANALRAATASGTAYAAQHTRQGL